MYKTLHGLDALVLGFDAGLEEASVRADNDAARAHDPEERADRRSEEQERDAYGQPSLTLGSPMRKRPM
jgi:hypothetical protein